jgi:hypothetical protein
VKTLGCILKENIKMDHKEIERDCVDWIRLTQDEDSGGLLGTR